MAHCNNLPGKQLSSCVMLKEYQSRDEKAQKRCGTNGRAHTGVRL
jgi:hypothetical protein